MLYSEFSVWFSSNFVASWFTVAPLCECEIALFHAALPILFSSVCFTIESTLNKTSFSCLSWLHFLLNFFIIVSPVLLGTIFDFYPFWRCPEMVSLVDMPLCKYSILQHQAIEMHLFSEVFCSCSHQPWLIFSSFLLSLSTPTLVLFYIQNTLDISIISA